MVPFGRLFLSIKLAYRLKMIGLSERNTCPLSFIMILEDVVWRRVQKNQFLVGSSLFLVCYSDINRGKRLL